MPADYWTPGTEIVWHYGMGDDAGPWWEEPMRVIRDDQRGLVAWLPMGTHVRHPRRLDGQPIRVDKSTMFTTPMVPQDSVWERTHVLRITVPGRLWTVWAFFDGVTGEFSGWYGNIEGPQWRDQSGTYSHDYVLDVCVEPDRSYSRKDEDELQFAVEQGRFTKAEAERITVAAAELEAVIEAWGSPFCDGWERFRPDPEWPLPQLPPVPQLP